MRLIYALLVLSFGLSFSASAEERYTCERNLLGCYTVYSGDANPEDAAKYLNQSRQVVADVIMESSRINTVLYEMATGKVILTPRPGKFIGPGEPRKVFYALANAHLKVSGVYVIDGAYEKVAQSFIGHYDRGGRSRFAALSKVQMSTSEYLVESSVYTKK